MVMSSGKPVIIPGGQSRSLTDSDYAVWNKQQQRGVCRPSVSSQGSPFGGHSPRRASLYRVTIRTAVTEVGRWVHVGGTSLEGELYWSAGQKVGVTIETIRVGELSAQLSKLMIPLLEAPGVETHVRVEIRFKGKSNAKDGNNARAGAALPPVMVEVEIVPGELAPHSPNVNATFRTLLRGACTEEEWHKTSNYTSYMAWENGNRSTCNLHGRVGDGKQLMGIPELPDAILQKVQSKK